MSVTPEHSPILRLLGVASGWGAKDQGSKAGPEILASLGLEARLRHRGLEASWRKTLYPQAGNAAVATVAELNQRLAREVAEAVQAGERFAVLGGDHSSAIGTWSGASLALRESGPLGLIWIDAHLDSHVPATSPSGALHGMPLACLFGYGDSALTGIGGAGRKLSPERTCLIGVRSFEAGEHALLQGLGVRVYFMEEVLTRGLEAIFAEALAIARNGAGFGVSIDLDAIDPRDAPGVATPEPGGIRGEELLRVLPQLRDCPDFLGIEIAELNPSLDRNRSTAYLAADLLLAATAPRPPAVEDPIAVLQRYGAHNYDSVPVVLCRGEGVYLWDTAGRRYLDMMGAYSAASHGHGHPRLVKVLSEQARRLAIVSRAFHNDRLAAFLQRACELTGQDTALPMNTGAEGVETALKAARKWAYQVKGVAPDQAEIVACRGNFHGRTIAIVGLSSEPQYRQGFGPFPPGLKTIPYGDSAALEAAIGENTAAFLVEPIQGEGGIVVPPSGYLAACARICRERNVLLLCDEIQTGLGRTGKLLASWHEDVRPDGLILGKALGGGLLPVSLFLARREVMDVFRPGDHGSTFGGNPLAAAVGLEALDVLVEEGLAERSAELGAYFLERLRALRSPLIREVRGRGLFVGLEIEPERVSGRRVVERLLKHGILTRETHKTVIRFAPPLVIEREQLDGAVEEIGAALEELEDAG
ncbi:MAG TPA: ornithine--oxo-acid transaminase [Methylococcaceae bacterium]|nr:ornithine--oxo-acid transaminase [Methylococcaceae bacterium]